MSYIILLLLGICLCNNDINRKKQIVEIVNNMNTTWKAKYYGDDFQGYYGLDLSFEDKDFKTKVYPKPNKELPKEYDLRKVYPYCETLTEIRDQSKCGACWAFATAEVMSDRLCIKSKGKLQTRVSAQHLVSCCSTCGRGCKGGWSQRVYSYWERVGVY